MSRFPFQKTHAHRKLNDDVPEDVKIDRMTRLDAVYRRIAEELNREYINSRQIVLIEGVRYSNSYKNKFINVRFFNTQDSKRSSTDFQGRNDANVKVNFPKAAGLKPGDYCAVTITEANSQGLRGRSDGRTSLSGQPLENDSQRLSAQHK